jgi:hypothetical protein
MKATTLPEQPDAKSPAGADIRFLMDGETGNMIHCTVPPHQVNKASANSGTCWKDMVRFGETMAWRAASLLSLQVPRSTFRWEQLFSTETYLT